MPGTVSDGPTVSLSFANNFWGKDDAGVQPLLERMHGAKVTSDEVKAFYSARAAIEDEYARKLLGLCRKPLGSCEAGTLRASLDTLRGEVESMGKAHQGIAGQMKSELEEPLAAFAGGLKERRKIVQSGIEKLLKVKTQQTQAVNKSRDRYEQDCLRIKGYLAQGHMVMGQEERKNKAKLEKTQIQVATSNNEYEAAVKALEETTVRWNREWKAACDKFQDLEEERLDFMKSSVWSFANIASTVCVSDDASCEKIRLSLEACEVEKDIVGFIRERGTGQEIPDAPKYINFRRGDVQDGQSDVTEDEHYSVAQFQRTVNPAFRSSSPQPSAFEPQRELAMHAGPPMASRDGPASSARASPAALDYRGQVAGNVEYQASEHGPLASVPHNQYPMDGMTMLCRAGPASERSTATSPARRSSRDSQSEYSNPTSFSSQEPASGKQSPTKLQRFGGQPAVAAADEKQVQKKKSGFFQNHSPFRRKSKHEREPRGGESSQAPAIMAASDGGNSWSAASGRHAGLGDRSVTKAGPMYGSESQAVVLGGDRQSGSPEPVDPRANFQLNVGHNVFDVDPPDAQATPRSGAKKHGLAAAATATATELDPIAQALAELKGVTKQSSMRMSADRYHGLRTPAPASTVSTPLAGDAVHGAQRGTPPPSYEQPMKRLDAPQPAFTSAQMQQTRQKYVDQAQNVFGRSAASSDGGRPGTGQYPVRSQTGPAGDLPRATSPSPMRSTSPRPGWGERRGGYRSESPNPYGSSGQKRGSNQSSPGGYDDGHGQLDDRYGGSQRSRGGMHGRPTSQYHGHRGGSDGMAPAAGPGYASSRARSKSVNDGRQFTRDGRPILQFARAQYMYQAAIPEELSFSKGDILAVLRMQDDGWWEAEVAGKNGRPGLVPSNYLQNI